MSDAVHVRAPCRLHFGMFSFGHADRPQFGGVGVMVEPPAVEVTITTASEFCATGALTGRVKQIVQATVTVMESSQSASLRDRRPFPTRPRRPGCWNATQLGGCCGVAAVLGSSRTASRAACPRCRPRWALCCGNVRFQARRLDRRCRTPAGRHDRQTRGACRHTFRMAVRASVSCGPAWARGTHRIRCILATTTRTRRCNAAFVGHRPQRNGPHPRTPRMPSLWRIGLSFRAPGRRVFHRRARRALRESRNCPIG